VHSDTHELLLVDGDAAIAHGDPLLIVLLALRQHHIDDDAAMLLLLLSGNVATPSRVADATRGSD
jgi:hypothetical protein